MECPVVWVGCREPENEVPPRERGSSLVMRIRATSWDCRVKSVRKMHSGRNASNRKLWFLELYSHQVYFGQGFSYYFFLLVARSTKQFKIKSIILEFSPLIWKDGRKVWKKSHPTKCQEAGVGTQTLPLCVPLGQSCLLYSSTSPLDKWGTGLEQWYKRYKRGCALEYVLRSIYEQVLLPT